MMQGNCVPHESIPLFPKHSYARLYATRLAIAGAIVEEAAMKRGRRRRREVGGRQHRELRSKV